MREKLTFNVWQWFLQTKKFVTATLSHQAAGLGFLMAYLLVIMLYPQPVWFHVGTAATGEWSLVLLWAWWVIIFTSHVGQDEAYTVSSGNTVEQVSGNRTWVAFSYLLIATVAFWMLGTPRVPFILLGILQGLPFLRTKFMTASDAKFNIPKIGNAILLVLAGWIMGAGY